MRLKYGCWYFFFSKIFNEASTLSTIKRKKNEIKYNLPKKRENYV